MKLIVNTSNLKMGGAIQVALSFIYELKKIGKDKYYVFLSRPVSNQINTTIFPENFKFYYFDESPVSLYKRGQINRRLSKLEDSINPDVVFTLFGPSYWRPRTVHIVGFALGWAINPKSVAYSRLGLIGSIKMRMSNRYKKFYLKRDGDYLIGETDDVKSKLIKFNYNVKERIFVINNTYNSVFDNEIHKKFDIPRKNDEFRLITISAYYPHKNLSIINDVISILKKAEVKCTFYVTLPKVRFDSLFRGVEDWVINLGPVPIEVCPSIYEQCDALFLPTLLESFSASYPEAMRMGLPILTSNLDFAKAICADAAEYFNPLDPSDIAQQIRRLICDKNRRNELINLGRIRLRDFPTAQKRAQMYLDTCQDLCTLKAN